MEQHDRSVVEPETQYETFKTRALAEMEKIGKHHGGPAQYLWNMMPSDEHKMQFAVWLWDTFPEQDEHLYHHEVRLPPTSETDIGQTPLFACTWQHWGLMLVAVSNRLLVVSCSKV